MACCDVTAGANFLVRKMASLMSPGLEITQDGDAFIIKLLSTFMPQESSFTVGTEYEEKQHSGDIMMVQLQLILMFSWCGCCCWVLPPNCLL